MKRYVPENILSEILDLERFNKDVKQLKVKVRKVYKKRKFGQPYQTELKLLFKELLVAKRKAQENLLRSPCKTKVEAEQSSVSMLNDVKEREKVFRLSGTKMASLLQIYSVANVIIRKFNQQNQVYLSPLVLTL
jgi:hypothetical protein